MPDNATFPELLVGRLPLVLLALASCSALSAQSQPTAWRAMFDGKTLQNWRETLYTDRGEVRVENGTIVMGAGKPLTGVNWTGSFPRNNYEVRFEGARLQGNDFFAALTFPVGDSVCTWVTGGWGGDIVGLSSIDGWDASDNETRSYFTFEKDRWYALRLRVSESRIMAWIDDVQVIDVNVEGRTLSLYFGETRLSAPFGFASYRTSGGLRKIEYRLLWAPSEDHSRR
jgi:hypothetical protein